MHVGLVIAGDIDDGSGGFYYDRRLRDRLRDRGHEVTVASLSWESYPRQLADALRARRIATQLDAIGADVLVEDGLAHPSLVAVNPRVETPTVALLHMIASRARAGLVRYGVRQIERRFLSTVDAAVYNAEATRRAAEAMGAPERSVVAPPAGDRFSPDVSTAAIRERAAERPLEITFLGNVVERKGLDALVEGVSRLDRGSESGRSDGGGRSDTDGRSVDYRLTVVGDTDRDPAYVDRVRDAAADAGIAGRIQFTGRLDDDAVADRLRETHVLAVPSRYEPFGMVYLEAMGFGCVPLATTVGGAAEFVRDGESGFLVAPEDADAIADRLRRLADRERLAEMGTAARQAYEAWPTWTESMDDAVDFFEEVAR
ncbi:glycosyltransferase family 4 protein [Halorubrum sp. DTA46]|uniref:glycosyltransferase family 4 protein n=1 Tax=Halorubrum sp. DTA46 TaxID=3402162 RepID=UPI003AAC0E5C